MEAPAGTLGSHLPATWGLQGDPLPAIRRGFLVAVPVAAGLLAQLALDDRVAGAFATAAVFCMGLTGAAGGYLIAVSPRMAILGLTLVLTLLVAQGLSVEVHQTWEALAIGVCAGLAQAVLAAIAWALWDRESEGRFQ